MLVSGEVNYIQINHNCDIYNLKKNGGSAKPKRKNTIKNRYGKDRKEEGERVKRQINMDHYG